jgi:4-amino-4-deoxy-L-arabinose transferase-like glycosyltransferase
MNEGRNPPSFWIYVVGAVLFAVLMALSGRYGFHRDELYMLQCGQHPQASYVDQPVLAPLLARVSFAMFGLSPAALRWWAALASVATAVVGGLTAREFGGGRRAQLLAAVAAATMPVVFGGGHIANTTPLMMLGEASLGLITARSGRAGDTRWWLAAGVVAGIGAEDNHLVGILALALVIGALASGVRPDRWLAAGVAIAVALMAPDIWWQATHGWATFAMTHALNERNGGLVGIVTWLFGQLADTALAMVWVWPAGLKFLWRSGRPMWRAIPWAYGLLFIVFMLTTGKQYYYLAGVYVTLLAARGRGDRHRQLQRGGRDQRAGQRAAESGERAQHVLVVGARQPARHHRPGRGPGWHRHQRH